MEKFRQKRSKITSIADRSSSDRFYSAERAHREGQIVFLFFLYFHFLCFFFTLFGYREIQETYFEKWKILYSFSVWKQSRTFKLGSDD